MTEEQKIKEFMEKFVAHGKECGNKIAGYLKKTYPKAVVIPLYRSAIAFQLNGDTVKLYACGDPHCMGEEIDDKTLANWTREWVIVGRRFGPEILYFIADKLQNERNYKHLKIML